MITILHRKEGGGIKEVKIIILHRKEGGVGGGGVIFEGYRWLQGGTDKYAEREEVHCEGQDRGGQGVSGRFGTHKQAGTPTPSFYPIDPTLSKELHTSIEYL